MASSETSDKNRPESGNTTAALLVKYARMSVKQAEEISALKDSQRQLEAKLDQLSGKDPGLAAQTSKDSIGPSSSGASCSECRYWCSMVDQMEKEADKARQASQQLASQLSSCEIENCRLTAKVAKLSDGSLQKQLDDLEKGKKRLQQEVNVLRCKLKNLSTAPSGTKDPPLSLEFEARLKEAWDERDSLRVELEASEISRSAAQGQLEASQELNSQLQVQLSRAVAKSDSLMADWLEGSRQKAKSTNQQTQVALSDFEDLEKQHSPACVSNGSRCSGGTEMRELTLPDPALPGPLTITLDSDEDVSSIPTNELKSVKSLDQLCKMSQLPKNVKSALERTLAEHKVLSQEVFRLRTELNMDGLETVRWGRRSFRIPPTCEIIDGLQQRVEQLKTLLDVTRKQVGKAQHCSQLATTRANESDRQLAACRKQIDGFKAQVNSANLRAQERLSQVLKLEAEISAVNVRASTADNSVVDEISRFGALEKTAAQDKAELLRLREKLICLERDVEAKIARKIAEVTASLSAKPDVFSAQTNTEFSVILGQQSAEIVAKKRQPRPMKKVINHGTQCRLELSELATLQEKTAETESALKAAQEKLETANSEKKTLEENLASQCALLDSSKSQLALAEVNRTAVAGQLRLVRKVANQRRLRFRRQNNFHRLKAENWRLERAGLETSLKVAKEKTMALEVEWKSTSAKIQQYEQGFDLLKSYVAKVQKRQIVVVNAMKKKKFSHQRVVNALYEQLEPLTKIPKMDSPAKPEKPPGPSHLVINVASSDNESMPASTKTETDAKPAFDFVDLA